MSLLQSRYTWTFDASSGAAATPIDFRGEGLEARVYFDANAGMTTGTIAVQSARNSTGPFATITSTVVASTGASVTMLTLTGPVLWIRPSVPSTGWVVEAVMFG